MLPSMISRPLVGVLLALTAVHAIPQGTFVTETTSSTTSTDATGRASVTQVTITSTSLGLTETTITSTASANTSSRSLLATSSATFTSQTTSTTGLPSGAACNNSPLLCNRTYDDIVHLGAHNSPFLRNADTDFSQAGSQYFNATVSLAAGVRLLQAQVHFEAGILKLCHTSCSVLDAGTLSSWLSDIRAWLDANPYEVVTLLLVNSDDVHIEFFSAAFDQSGMSGHGYIPPFTSASSTAVWPTLGELITANTRLVTFVAGLRPSAYYPYLLDEWQYVFETPDRVLSPDFVCDVNRPTHFSSLGREAAEAGVLPLLNHFGEVPLGRYGALVASGEGIIDLINSPSERDADAEALGLHMRTCEAAWQAKPVFVLVDFWNRGPAIMAIDEMNGVVGTIQGRIAPAAVVKESGTAPRFGGVEEKAACVGLVGLVVALVLLF